MLTVEHLSFQYRSNTATLKDISFSIPAGHCVALLGNNGAGKSTLLKCLNHILRPDTGTVMLDEKNLLRMNHRETAQHIAFVAQSVPGIQMTVHDTIMLGRKPYMKFSFSEKDYRLVQDIMVQFHLTKMSDRLVSQLSGGEQQKIMLARALVQEPQILLLDEPTSNLDLQNQYQVLQIVQNTCRTSGITAVVILHDLNLALRFCDYFLILKNGELIRSGDSSILNRDILEEVYHIHADITEINGRKIVLVD